jgi:hypothetical protein
MSGSLLPPTFYGFCGCGREATHIMESKLLACNPYSRCSPRREAQPSAEKASQAINEIARRLYRGASPEDTVSAIRMIVDGLS